MTGIGTCRLGVTLLLEVELLPELDRSYYLGVDEPFSFCCCMLVANFWMASL